MHAVSPVRTHTSVVSAARKGCSASSTLGVARATPTAANSAIVMPAVRAACWGSAIGIALADVVDVVSVVMV